jgi:quercetin dioxygenase-like cupin family protein
MSKAMGIAFLVLIVAALGGTALATPGAKVSGTTLATAAIEEGFAVESDGIRLRANEPTDVIVQSAVFEPGGHSGWHGHRGVIVIAVKSGTITKYFADCVGHTYEAGDAFVEHGPRKVIIRNEGTVPTELAITYILPKGKNYRIDKSSPGCGVEDPAGR